MNNNKQQMFQHGYHWITLVLLEMITRAHTS